MQQAQSKTLYPSHIEIRKSEFTPVTTTKTTGVSYVLPNNLGSYEVESLKSSWIMLDRPWRRSNPHQLHWTSRWPRVMSLEPRHLCSVVQRAWCFTLGFKKPLFKAESNQKPVGDFENLRQIFTCPKATWKQKPQGKARKVLQLSLLQISNPPEAFDPTIHNPGSGSPFQSNKDGPGKQWLKSPVNHQREWITPISGHPNALNNPLSPIFGA